MRRYNPKWIEIAAMELSNYKYLNQNYYLTDEDICAYALELILKGLEANLSQCLNVSQGYCDIWYKESHSGCKQLMDQIADIKGDDIIQLEFDY